MGTGDGVSLDLMRRTALYRLYDADGDLLYIGIGFNPVARYREHRKTKRWWPQVARREVTWYETRTAADMAEREAILAEDPRYNVLRWEVFTPPLRRAPDTQDKRDLREDLTRDSRALGRADRARERARQRLGETIVRAAAEDIGPAEIRRLIEHRFTEKTISRIIQAAKDGSSAG